MSDKILLRRGNKTDLPVLNVGEPGIALDEKRLYFGTSGGNVALPKKEQESVIAPTMLNAWILVRGGYYKDDFGIVHFALGITAGAITFGTTIFNFPVGYRPAVNGDAYYEVFASTSGTVGAGTMVEGSIIVKETGDVQFQRGNNGYMFLRGSFRAA